MPDEYVLGLEVAEEDVLTRAFDDDTMREVARRLADQGINIGADSTMRDAWQRQASTYSNWAGAVTSGGIEWPLSYTVDIADPDPPLRVQTSPVTITYRPDIEVLRAERDRTDREYYTWIREAEERRLAVENKTGCAYCDYQNYKYLEVCDDCRETERLRTLRGNARGALTYHTVLGSAYVRNGEYQACPSGHVMYHRTDDEGILACHDHTCRYTTPDMALAYSRINSYGFKPEPEFKGYSKDGLYFGLEMEYETFDSPRSVVRDMAQTNQGLIYFKRDGSIRNGFEAVTHPMSFGYFRDNFPLEFMRIAAERCTNSAEIEEEVENPDYVEGRWTEDEDGNEVWVDGEGDHDHWNLQEREVNT
jgi:hypothetical protein